MELSFFRVVCSFPHLFFFLLLSSGVAPPSAVMIQAGQTIHTFTSYRDTMMTYGNITWVAFFAILSLLPIIFKKQLREKFD